MSNAATDEVECTNIVQEEGKLRYQRLPLTTFICMIVTTRCEKREPRSWLGKCDRDRWIGAAIVPTKGADEYAVAELKNDVMCSGFTEVLIRSDNEPSRSAAPKQQKSPSKSRQLHPRNQSTFSRWSTRISKWVFNCDSGSSARTFQS